MGRERRLLPFAVAGFGLVIGALAEIAAARGIYSTTEVVVDSAYGVDDAAGRLCRVAHATGVAAGAAHHRDGRHVVPGRFRYGTDQALVDLDRLPAAGLERRRPRGADPAVPHRPARLAGPAAWVLGGVVLSHLGLSLSRLLLRPPLDPSTCFCVPNRFLPITDPAAYDAADRVFSVAEAGFAIAALVLVVAALAQPPPGRRAARWDGWPPRAAVTAAILSYNRLYTRLGAEWIHTGPTVRMVIDVVSLSIPLAVAVVLVRGRARACAWPISSSGLSREGLADPRAELRKALADPSVQLVRWSRRSSGAYVDDEGSPVSLPDGRRARRDGARRRRHAPRRARPRPRAARRARAADVGGRGRPDGAAQRAARRRGSVAARAGAGLPPPALEVAEAERHRLERDLHDGAQQYLLALTMQARRAQRRAEAAGDPELGRQLAAADRSGHHRARAAPVPRPRDPPAASQRVRPRRRPAHRWPSGSRCRSRQTSTSPGRLDDAVEATAYFVASEALTNVLKYARGRPASARRVDPPAARSS